MGYFLIFLTSFCSFSYEFLIGKISYNFFGDIRYYLLSMGVFITFLGLGSLKKVEKIDLIEFKLSIIGLMLPVFLLLLDYIAWESYIFEVKQQFEYNKSFNLDTNIVSIKNYLDRKFGIHFWILIFGLIFTNAILGFFTGMELPNFLERYKLKFNRTLFLNYLGSITSSFFVVVIITYFCDEYNSILIIAFINFSIFLLLSKKSLYSFIYLLFFIFSLNFMNYQIEFLQKKITYISKVKYINSFNGIGNLKEKPKIEVFSTRYQKVEKIKYKNHFSIFLNNHLQFDSRYEKAYHNNMVNIPISVYSNKIKDVLILGGGDGLILRELLKYKYKIDHVELDEKFLMFCKEDTDISSLNNKSLESNKFHLIIKDAFEYLKYNNKKYDLIILDFPFPYDFELSRLYSIEFYNLLMRSIHPHSIIVLDAPIRSRENLHNKYEYQYQKEINTKLVSTIYYAGFKDFLIYTSRGEGYIIASPKQGNINKKLFQRVYGNQIKIPYNIDKKTINSVFDFGNLNVKDMTQR